MSCISTLALDAEAYDALRKLVVWVDLTPANLELSEGIWDRIGSLMGEPFEGLVPEDLDVMSVEIGSVDSKQAGDALIAVLGDDDGNEWRVLVTRNPEGSAGE